MNMKMTFGDWLKRRRRQLDLTQKELANLAGCGLGTLRKIEQGTRRPSKDLAASIGAALDIPAEQMPRLSLLRAATLIGRRCHGPISRKNR